MAQIEGREMPEKEEDVKDCCFCLNQKSMVGSTLDIDSDYSGLLSLQSTTITDFHFGVLSGFSSILNLEKSSIINGRGSALRLANPKIFKA